MPTDNQPICEWCGMLVKETGESCLARDGSIKCDPDPYGL